MIETVLRSQDLPAADRFAWWQDMAHRSLLPTMIRSDYEEAFHATVRRLDLGVLHLSWMSSSPLQARRTRTLIRHSDPGSYCLSLTVRGSRRLDQGGHQMIAGAQDLLLYDTAQPFHAHLQADTTGRAEGIILHIPRSQLILPPGTPARLTAERLPGSTGIGALLAEHLTSLARHTATCTPADAARLSTITLDLVAATLAHHRGADTTFPAETHRQALQMRIHAYIEQHLGDPDLCAETVAAAHQISTRHLYRLFQDQGLSVATWIRHRRLERCRRDLTDPALSSRPIHAIATRWGFANIAHFSRVFRTTYGASPADYRHYAALEARRKSATSGRKPSTTS